LNLARALQSLGSECRFIVNQDQAVQDYLKRYGFDGLTVGDDDIADLQQTLKIAARLKADVLVIDSYEVREDCFSKLRGPVIVVIDDLADRALPVDVVVNGAPLAHELRYQTASRTRLLLGPEYVLLGDGFSGLPERFIKPQVERVLITVGGMDQNALTPRLIRWVREALPAAELDVVAGPFFGDEAVKQTHALAEADAAVAVWTDPPSVCKLMMESDLAVAGGGQTTYELAATGTPAVAIRLVDNQTGNLKGFSSRGVLDWIGDSHDADLQAKLQAAIRRLAGDPGTREKMSRAGRQMVDGRGAFRVAKAILEACEN
jgi:spore coat polysaccharide biosynthesis predicted glycosyltransferase SpsG